ncbi:MAG TPA: protein kinase [Kofleriaceae bacterium]
MLRERIGEGGFGAVYRAEQPLLGREAVVKILHRQLRANDNALQRFLREARLASRLDHPYAAHVYAFGAEPDGLVWIAMEMVRGTPLDSWIADKGPLSIDDMVPFFERLAEVVHSVHEHGIVHRDLKPSNVMVTARAGRLLPKLLDLGIAKVIDETAPPPDAPVASKPMGGTMQIPGRGEALGIGSDNTLMAVPAATPRAAPRSGATTVLPMGMEDTLAPYKTSATGTPIPERSASSVSESLPLVARLTQVGATIGSPPYMAPEQWIDAWSAGPRADVYSLGILAYECLAGRRPFKAPTTAAYMEQHVNAPVPPLGDKFPPAFDRFFTRALAKRAEDRPATALELAAAFRIACGKSDDTTTLPQLEPAVRDAWLADAPEPLAGAVAVLDAARNAHQAREATWDLVRAVVRYLLAIALATRAQIRGEADVAQLVDLLRAMRTRELADEERVRLIRLLVRPFASKRGAYPIPELVDLVASPKQGERHVLDRLFELRTASDANQRADDLVRSHLSRLLPAVAQFLRATSFVLDYPLVVTTGDDVRGISAERWVGLRRARRPTAALAKLADLDAHRAFIVDRDGNIVQHLHPVVQVVAPSPGLPDDLFVFEGRGRHGALMIATPTGYERHDPTLWDWLGEHALGDDVEAQTSQQERAPYLGLATFQTADADRFVGREREIDAFVNRLRGQTLQIVVGASGAGKSSFVHAGVVPALPKTWQVVTLRPGSAPVSALVSRLGAAGLATIDLDHSPDALIASLRKPREDETTLLVVVDQLEEIFTACADEAERVRFAKLLAHLSASPDAPIRVVATIRDDFLMKLEALQPLRTQLSASLVLLGNPSVDDLVRTVVEPARRVGYALSDDDLAHDMATAVAERPAALALLSFTAAQLWELRDRRFKQLTRTAYDAMGGVGGALGRHAEDTLENLAADDQRLVREVFLRLVTSAGTRALVSPAELRQVLASPRADVVIEKLVAARLIVVVDAEGDGRVELVHEALIGAWPRLGNWLREDADGARMRDQLQAAARQWHERARPKDLLWRGDVLAELERWRRRPNPIALADVEAAFSEASRNEAARARRNRRAILVAAFAVLAVAIVILVRLTSVARDQRALAAASAEQAAASAAESKSRLADQYEEQGRLALLADRSGPALLYFLAAIEQGASRTVALDFMIDRAAHGLEAQRAVLRGHTARVVMVDLHGKHVLTASSDGTTRVWNLDAPAQARVIKTGDPNVFVARFSPRGDKILTAGDSGVPRLFSLDGRLLHELAASAEPITSAMTPAFSPDGATVLVPYIDGTLVLWDADTGARLATVTTEKAAIHAAFSPDGKVALLWGREFFPEVRHGKTLAPIAKLEAHKRPLSTITMSRTHVAIASRDKTITVWDMATWKLVHHLRGDTNVVEDVAFDPSGKKLVSTNRDGSARVWDVATGEMLVNLVGHHGTIRSGRFTPDGHHLVTASADGTARLWDVASGVSLATFEGHQRELTGLAVTNDLVVTAGADATARIYPLTPDRRVLAGHEQVPTTFAYSADGRRLAAGTGQAVWIWDPQAGSPVVKLGGALDAKLDPRDPSRMVAVYPDELRLLHNGAIAKTAPTNARLVGFLGDGRVAFTSGRMGSVVQLWDLGSGAITKLTEHANWITALAIADDLVVTGSDDTTARISTPSTGASIKLPHQKRVVSVAIDPTRKYVVTGSAELQTRVWDAQTGALLRSLATQDSTIVIAFDDRGHVLTAGRHEATAQVWKLADGSLVATLEGHGNRIEGAAFVMGELIATTGDETIRIWDLAKGRQLSVWRTHVIAVSGFALRPDRQEIATGAFDRTITLQPVGFRRLDLDALHRLVSCLPFAIEAGRLMPRPPSC